jgi:hypothetical protein
MMPARTVRAGIGVKREGTMLYFPLLDTCLTEYAPIVERVLVAAGQAILDPPHRPGGYRIGDDSLHMLLHRRACDMDRRHDTRY